MEPLTRRRFLALAAGSLASLPATLRGERAPFRHPDPRPGVDGSRVLDASGVPPHVAELYDQIRGIPEVADGIGCHCGCADIPGMYSLLSCYEGSGMASFCQICQGEGRMAYRLHREGHTLDEIRAAIDRRFG